MNNITESIDIFKLKKEIIELTIKEYEVSKLIKHMKGKYPKESLENLEEYKESIKEYRETIEVLVEDFKFWEERFCR